MPKKFTPIDAGKFYERDILTGTMREVPRGARPVAYVICRRVADYMKGPPAAAAITPCALCAAPIAFNPARQPAPDAPKVCMQCAGLTPEPF